MPSDRPARDAKFLMEAFRRAPLYLVISSLETGKFVEVNDAFVKTTGYSRADALGKSAVELGLWVDPAERSRGFAELEAQGFISEQEVRLRMKNGEVRDFLISAEVTELNGERCILNAAVDISRRKRAEANLHESRARLDFVLDSSRIGTWDLDLRSGRARTSFQHDRCFGATEPLPEWSYDIFLGYVHPDDRERVDRAFQRALTEQGDWHFECRVAWSDQTVRWIEAYGSHYLSEAGEITYMLGTVTDITRRKENELALAELNVTLETRVKVRTRQVQELAAQLTLAEARERGRLAQVLHDDLQQQLYAVQFSLHNIRKALHEERSGEGTLSSVEEASTRLKDAVAIARTTTANLSPPVLQGEGLVEALTWLGSDMRERHGLTVTINSSGTVSLPESVRVLLFNLVRELLFNVVKHAQTDAATVDLREQDEGLEITVSDLGQGFDPALLDKAQEGTGLGLSGVRKRLELFGGHLQVASTKGEGTGVTITLPTLALTLN